MALQTLLARNIIIAAHRTSSQHGYEATTYQLNIAAPEGKPELDPPGPKIGLAPWAENRPYKKQSNNKQYSMSIRWPRRPNASPARHAVGRQARQASST